MAKVELFFLGGFTQFPPHLIGSPNTKHKEKEEEVVRTLPIFTPSFRWIITVDDHSLVGGFKHVLFSIIYGMSSFPFDFHIFQRGRSTTKQFYMYHPTIDMAD